MLFCEIFARAYIITQITHEVHTYNRIIIFVIFLKYDVIVFTFSGFCNETTFSKQVRFINY